MTNTTVAPEAKSGTKVARKAGDRPVRKTAGGNGNAKPRQTKKGKPITLLKAKGGRNIVEISKTLEWQQHTTCVALTGLRKAGFEIERQAREGGGARYRIRAEPKQAPAG